MTELEEPVLDEPPLVSATVAGVLAKVREYLDLAASEETYVLVALAVAVSKALVDEEPLWALLVGPPGAGKTEAIRLLDGVVDAAEDEITRAGLLSWAPGKRPRKVGLLTKIPREALVSISDFSTVVTAGDREARARMFAALRVVYDGRLHRSIGGGPATQSGELAWEGHLTIVAGATNVIDTHASFEGALGERWLMVRVPESDATRARQRARFVVDRRDVGELRQQAQEETRRLVLRARSRIPELPAELKERVVDVAVFVAHARTGIVHEGQGRARVILGLPTPEEPTRLVGQLARLARCALALELTPEDALALATQAGLDSIALARLRAVEAIAEAGDAGATVSDVHRAMGRGNRWGTLWELDALEAIGLAEVEGPSRDEDPKAVRLYRLADEYRDVYASVGVSLSSLSQRGEEEDEKGVSSGLSLHMRTPSAEESARNGDGVSRPNDASSPEAPAATVGTAGNDARTESSS